MKLKYKVLFILVAVSLQIFVSIYISDKYNIGPWELVNPGDKGGFMVRNVPADRISIKYFNLFIRYFLYFSVLPIGTFFLTRKFDKKTLKDNDEDITDQ